MDNLGATFITKNPIGHLKLKHVALDLFFVQERIENDSLEVTHIVKKDQWENILTKALPVKNFTELRSKVVGDASELLFSPEV